MLTIAAFIVTIGILVTIHEYGHFQVARWCNVKVLRFSIGFGKPLWRKTFGNDNTEFVLAAIPLGGYVKMLDERVIASEQASEQSRNEALVVYSERDLARAFNRQSVWKRIAIVIAGPVANLLLAILLYWVIFMSGVMVMRPLIGAVDDDSPAAQAKLEAGELIKKIDGIAVESWQDVRWILLKKAVASSSISQSTVMLETINKDHELHKQSLDLSGLDKNDFESDILKKLGLFEFQPKIAPIVGEIIKNSIAEQAGLKVGDKVLSVNQIMIHDWEAFVKIVRANPNKQITLQIERKEFDKQTTQILLLTPQSLNQNNKTIGQIGVAAKVDVLKAQADIDKLLVKINYSPMTSLVMAADKTWDTSIFSLKMLGKMVTGQLSWKGISGPATIASYAGQSADLGFKVFLGFLATISISIGVLNLLPIPVLDGGHLMYYMIEIFKGSPVSERLMELGQRVGFGLLGLLMTIAIFNDINRFARFFIG